MAVIKWINLAEAKTQLRGQCIKVIIIIINALSVQGRGKSSMKMRRRGAQATVTIPLQEIERGVGGRDTGVAENPRTGTSIRAARRREMGTKSKTATEKEITTKAKQNMKPFKKLKGGNREGN